MVNNFIDTIHFPRIPVDFSNDMIWGDSRVLLSKNDVVIDNRGNSITLIEGMKIYAYEENKEENGMDNIIANGIFIKNNTNEKKQCKWLMEVDRNGIHYMSEFENQK